MTEAFAAGRTAAEIFADEIGIEIGIYGDWRLKAAFKPIFACEADGLYPVAVEGSTRPFVYGREVDGRMFRRAVPQRDRPTVASLSAALCLRNLQHTGVEGLKLILEADPGTGVSPQKIRAAVRALLGEVSRNGVDPADVIIRFSQLAAAGEQANVAAFEALRDKGFRIAFEERGEGLELDNLPFPDVVAIDGGWFRTVARQTGTAQLFRALVGGYRSQGAVVMIEGIGSAGDLRVALDSGAEWLSGQLLAPAALAGAVFPEGPLHVEMLLDEPRVIPLFR